MSTSKAKSATLKKTTSEAVAELVKNRNDLVGNKGEAFVITGMYGQQLQGLFVDGNEGELMSEDLIPLRPYLVLELDNTTVDYDDGIHQVD